MKDQVLKACRQMLVPITRLLIRGGVSWAEFAEASKQIFVYVARKDYGLQGRPTNTARVALMTGLSRREVTRLKQILTGGGDDEPAAPLSRIPHVLTGWHVDPDFLDNDGKPAKLAKTGKGATLETLLKRYAGDTPHGALFKELEQLGLIVANNGHFEVTARDYIRTAADPTMLRQAGIALYDHGATLVHNVDADRTEPARFERMATRIAISREDAKEFQAMLETRGQAFLEEIDQWLADREPDDPSEEHKGKRVRTGVGVYLIYDETQGTHDDDD